jgi:hypothetical protein
MRGSLSKNRRRFWLWLLSGPVVIVALCYGLHRWLVERSETRLQAVIDETVIDEIAASDPRWTWEDLLEDLPKSPIA